MQGLRERERLGLRPALTCLRRESPQESNPQCLDTNRISRPR
jgi:hypothetical protein